MAKRTKYAEPTPPIPPFDGAPGPDADIDVLRTHIQQVQTAFSTHRYDDVVMVCHWCCKDVELPFTDKDQPRGTRKYCSERCVEAIAKLRRLQPGRKHGPKPTTDTPVEEELPPEEPVPVEEPVPLEAITQVVGKEGTGRTTSPVRRRKAPSPAPKPKAAKAKAPKAKTPKAAKGMCPKGLHKMTPDNMYFYKNNVWCQKCRKASRAASAAKKAK